MRLSRRNTLFQIYSGRIKSTESGFSLVELSIVLAIIGVLIAISATVLRPYIDGFLYNSTRMKMEHIASVLADYAQKNYAVPCPAVLEPTSEPFGAPVGSGSDGSGNNGCVASSTTITRGIVPFRALGLQEQQVKDAFGNYIVYLAPTAPSYYLTPGNERNKAVHKYCRTPIWMDSVTGQNKNFRKAYFCCAAVDGVTMWDETHLTNANKAELFRRDNRRDGASTGLQDVANVDVAAPLDLAITHVPEMVVFALLSHGKNTTVITAPISNNGDDEAINRNNPLGRMIMRPLNTSIGSKDHFDDIVLFRTNYQLMSASRTKSCTRP